MLITPSQSTIQSWQDSLAKNGSRSIRIEVLLNHYHVKRRGKKVVEEILEHLAGLEPPIYAPKFVDTTLPATSRIDLCRNNTGPGGKTFSTALRHERRDDEDKTTTRAAEAKFKKQHLGELLEALGLALARVPEGESPMEFSPRGTRDRLDAICEDKQGRLVALEIKLRDGERRGVEQLLRYTQQLWTSKASDERLVRYRAKPVRAVLVTGEADQPTREAIATLDPYEVIDWYRYAMDKKTRKLEDVTECEVERDAPSNPFEVRLASDVRVGKNGKTFAVGLRKFEAQLSLAAARKLHHELGEVIGKG